MSTTIGLVGAGQIPAKNCIALLEDFIGDDDRVGFVLAVDLTWGATHDEIFDWISDRKYPYVAIHDDDAAEDKNLAVIIKGATEAVKVTRVERKVVEALKEGDGVLALLWDEEAEEDDYEGDPGYEALLAADEKGVKAYDLSDGFDRISFMEVDEEQEETDELIDQAQGKFEADPDEQEEDEESTETPNGPSREALEAMTRSQIKILVKEAVKLGMAEVSARAHTATMIDELVAFYQSGGTQDAPEDVQEATEDEVVEEEVTEAPSPRTDDPGAFPQERALDQYLDDRFRAIEDSLKLEFEGLFAAFRDEVIEKIDEIRTQHANDAKKNSDWFTTISDAVISTHHKIDVRLDDISELLITKKEKPTPRRSRA